MKRRVDALQSRVAALSLQVDVLVWSAKYPTMVGPTSMVDVPVIDAIDLAKHINMIKEYLGVERVAEPAREYLRKKETPAA